RRSPHTSTLCPYTTLFRSSYEKLPEEDIVRLQWYGLYHDKPKIGTFMMRIKIPSRILTAEGLRTIGEVSEQYGRDQGELTTRQKDRKSTRLNSSHQIISYA